MTASFGNIKNIVDKVLGDSKTDYGSSGDWYEYNCPYCAEENMGKPDGKYNFAVQIGSEGLWGHCWSCLHTGKLYHIIKRFGTQEDVHDFKEEVNMVREAGLYKMNGDLTDEVKDTFKEELQLPDGYQPLYYIEQPETIKVKYDSSLMPSDESIWEFLAKKYIKYAKLITAETRELVKNISNYKIDEDDLGEYNQINGNKTYKDWFEKFKSSGSYEWFYNLIGKTKDEIIDTIVVNPAIRAYTHIIRNANQDIQKPLSDGNEISIPYPYDTITLNRHNNPKQALDYLKGRGVGSDLIERFRIGYVPLKHGGMYSGRIVIPSYDAFGDLSFWVARDFTERNKVKMFNPKVDKKKIVFNEERVNWYEPITIVEGPFDHIVVPNSIPLLGKYLDEDNLIYKRLVEKSRSEIYIMLDNDAEEKAVKMYCELINTFRGRLKIIFLPDGYDPSDYYRDYGKKGIIEMLKSARELNDAAVNTMLMGGDYSMVREFLD